MPMVSRQTGVVVGIWTNYVTGERREVELPFYEEVYSYEAQPKEIAGCCTLHGGGFYSLDGKCPQCEASGHADEISGPARLPVGEQACSGQEVRGAHPQGQEAAQEGQEEVEVVPRGRYYNEPYAEILRHKRALRSDREGLAERPLEPYYPDEP